MNVALWSLPVYAVLWGMVFYWQPFDFWLLLPACSAIVLAFSLVAGRRRQLMAGWFSSSARSVLLGMATGAGLYVLFLAGFDLLSLLWPAPIESQVVSLYTMTVGIDPQWMSLLLVCVVIPGEELYWRGVIQGAALQRFRPWVAIVGSSLLYAAVNAWSGNVLQVLAALVCGVVWGGLAWWTGGLVAPLVAHVLWDLLMLVLLPLV